MHLDFSVFVIALFGHLVWSDHFSPCDTPFPEWELVYRTALNAVLCVFGPCLYSTILISRPPESVVTKYHVLSSAPRFN